MIRLPVFKKSFEYENNFYLSCDASRLSKVVAHYELYKLCKDIPGDIVECGVFKGASLSRFAIFRQLLNNPASKRIIAFDTFGAFPATGFNGDTAQRDEFIRTAGPQSISRSQLASVLKKRGLGKNVELVQGDITRTVPAYLKKRPELKISFLNLDTDIYEPAVTILEHLYPRLSRGGVLLLDDYGVFPGETKAADDYFKDKDVEIRKLPFCVTPSYIIKKK